MDRVVPYEHRGSSYRAIAIVDSASARKALYSFQSEEDAWLRKIIALKITSARHAFELELPENELEQAIKCRVE